jgi:hypothetical protein
MVAPVLLGPEPGGQSPSFYERLSGCWSGRSPATGSDRRPRLIGPFPRSVKGRCEFTLDFQV